MITFSACFRFRKNQVSIENKNWDRSLDLFIFHRPNYNWMTILTAVCDEIWHNNYSKNPIANSSQVLLSLSLSQQMMLLTNLWWAGQDSQGPGIFLYFVLKFHLTLTIWNQSSSEVRTGQVRISSMRSPLAIRFRCRLPAICKACGY